MLAVGVVAVALVGAAGIVYVIDWTLRSLGQACDAIGRTVG